MSDTVKLPPIAIPLANPFHSEVTAKLCEYVDLRDQMARTGEKLDQTWKKWADASALAPIMAVESGAKAIPMLDYKDFDKLFLSDGLPKAHERVTKRERDAKRWSYITTGVRYSIVSTLLGSLLLGHLCKIEVPLIGSTLSIGKIGLLVGVTLPFSLLPGIGVLAFSLFSRRLSSISQLVTAGFGGFFVGVFVIWIPQSTGRKLAKDGLTEDRRLPLFTKKLQYAKEELAKDYLRLLNGGLSDGTKKQRLNELLNYCVKILDCGEKPDSELTPPELEKKKRANALFEYGLEDFVRVMELEAGTQGRKTNKVRALLEKSREILSSGESKEIKKKRLQSLYDSTAELIKGAMPKQNLPNFLRALHDQAEKLLRGRDALAEVYGFPIETFDKEMVPLCMRIDRLHKNLHSKEFASHGQDLKRERESFQAQFRAQDGLIGPSDPRLGDRALTVDKQIERLKVLQKSLLRSNADPIKVEKVGQTLSQLTALKKEHERLIAELGSLGSRIADQNILLKKDEQGLQDALSLLESKLSDASALPQHIENGNKLKAQLEEVGQSLSKSLPSDAPLFQLEESLKWLAQLKSELGEGDQKEKAVKLYDKIVACGLAIKAFKDAEEEAKRGITRPEVASALLAARGERKKELVQILREALLLTKDLSSWFSNCQLAITPLPLPAGANERLAPGATTDQSYFMGLFNRLEEKYSDLQGDLSNAKAIGDLLRELAKTAELLLPFETLENAAGIRGPIMKWLTEHEKVEKEYTELSCHGEEALLRVSINPDRLEDAYVLATHHISQKGKGWEEMRKLVEDLPNGLVDFNVFCTAVFERVGFSQEERERGVLEPLWSYERSSRTLGGLERDAFGVIDYIRYSRLTHPKVGRDTGKEKA